MPYDLKVPKTPGAQAGKHACGRCGLIKGGGISSFVAAFCTKSQRLAMLPGGTKLATHDLTATAISAARVAPKHHITPAGRGETQPKKTLTIASQAKGTAFSVKPSGIFRKSSHHFLPTTIGSTRAQSDSCTGATRRAAWTAAPWARPRSASAATGARSAGEDRAK